MRLRNLFFALAASIGVAAAPAGAQAMADSVVSGPFMLTLEQAPAIALSDTPTVKITDQTVEVKKYAQRATHPTLPPGLTAPPPSTSSTSLAGSLSEFHTCAVTTGIVAGKPPC